MPKPLQEEATTLDDPRAVRSREALRSAMLVLLELKPFAQITVKDIVAEAGVGYTTFFRHYRDREALLNDVAAEEISRLFNLSIPVMDAEDLHSASLALFNYVKEHRALWSTLLTGGAASTIREEFLRQAREVAALRGPTGGWMQPEVGVVLIVSGTLELLTWWLRQEEPPPLENMARILDKVLVSPVIAAGIDDN